ncbi:MFS transporter [Cupriavidus basilensis]
MPYKKHRGFAPAPPRWLILVAIVAIGLNLRAFPTAVGATVAATIRAGTGLDYEGNGVADAAAHAADGVLRACRTGAIRQRLGARRAVLGALALLAADLALRALAADGTVLVTTAALCGLGVAVEQGQPAPASSSRSSPRRVALVMGLYSAAPMGGGALGAQIASVIANLSGSWQQGLGLAWHRRLRQRLASRGGHCRAQQDRHRQSLPRTGRPASSAPPPDVDADGLLRRDERRLCLARAWLAPLYQQHGWSVARSGSLVAVMAIAWQPRRCCCLRLAAARHDRRAWMAAALALQAAGFAGLALWPEGSPHMPYAWAIIGGAGLGGCFALYLVVTLDHLPDPDSAGALSALMQGGGFAGIAGAVDHRGAAFAHRRFRRGMVVPPWLRGVRGRAHHAPEPGALRRARWPAAASRSGAAWRAR